MQLTDHIVALLYRYECVVIPGLGAFLTHRQSAQFNEEESAFYPPKKTISFNRQLKENDGVLVNYIAKTEGISYEQAFQKIHAFIQNVHEALDAQHQVHLKKIGRFYRQGDKMLFQPDTQINYLTEAFGTSRIEISSINRLASQKPKIIPLTVVDPKEVELIDMEVVNAPVAEEKTVAKTNFWKYAAVGIIAIGLGGLLTANWYSEAVKSHNMAAQEQAEKQIESQIQQATFSIDDPLPEITFKVHAERGKYHIVAGAFRSEENAQKKLAELKESGFHPMDLGANQYGLHQVIYDSYKSREEASQKLREIRATNNPNAWLLVKEL